MGRWEMGRYGVEEKTEDRTGDKRQTIRQRPSRQFDDRDPPVGEAVEY